jgi:YD repeat-containing protein
LRVAVTDGDPEDIPPLPGKNEDRLGWTSTHEYDWRMRPVWGTERGLTNADTGADGPSLRHDLTWYDHLDRPVLTASYGALVNLNGAPDPREAAPNWAPDLTTVTAVARALVLVDDDYAPTAVTQTIYNARGQAKETRRWYANQPSGGGPATAEYTATRTYYNHRDQAVEVHAPNSPVQKSTYDAKGRQISSSGFSGTKELSRTTTTYDLNDRATGTTYWERMHNATVDGLDEAPDEAIKSYTYTWYDKAGKVIATANFGTNNTIFANGAEPPAYDDTTPPVIIDPATGQVTGLAGGIYSAALITAYAYDGAGNQSAVFHPDGTVTRTEYDDLGRVLLTTENADEAVSFDQVQRTAYRYDDRGRLSMMAAVFPDQFTGYDQINWDAPNGTAQVTEFLYGADVVDSGGGLISANNAFIKEVHFPDRQNGQPSAADALHFTYFSDGAVATRTDQRGMVFSHSYDELGRRVTSTIDDTAWYGVPPGQTDHSPPNRVRQVVYAYHGDGALAGVTAYTLPTGGVLQPLADNWFDYDP